ncbi:hypothetical protein BKA56DRAFT_716317 [Ilyonectria sp. MPI-CAGE-AT-0026]|nr:hypothetical protein BKA56DRAFT_716317 [Ilyonectria sp. MPI-CAGE-AT-0026]
MPTPATADKRLGQENLTSATKQRFPCLRCYKVFTGQETLTRHVLSHEISYWCNYENCKHKSGNQSNLNRHIREFHLKEKPYKCDRENCRYAFSTPGKLRGHKNSTHSKEKPIKCKKCGAGFSRPDSERRHRKTCRSMTNADEQTVSESSYVAPSGTSQLVFSVASPDETVGIVLGGNLDVVGHNESYPDNHQPSQPKERPERCATSAEIVVGPAESPAARSRPARGDHGVESARRRKELRNRKGPPTSSRPPRRKKPKLASSSPCSATNDTPQSITASNLSPASIPVTTNEQAVLSRSFLSASSHTSPSACDIPDIIEIASDGGSHGPSPPIVGWSVERIVDELTTYLQDINKYHAQLAAYIIESTEPTERRVYTGVDHFAGLNSIPAVAKKDKSMGVKFRTETSTDIVATQGNPIIVERSKKPCLEEWHCVVCIQTDEQRVPRYQCHHVEIKRNILAPNTIPTSIPQWRNPKGPEESESNFQELEDLERKCGFWLMSRDDKASHTFRSEYAATVSFYIEGWLKKISIPGCNTSSLVHYMAHHGPNTTNLHYDTDISRSHHTSEPALSEANKAIKMFVEAFHLVFRKAQPPPKQIELRDVLLPFESVDSTAKVESTPENSFGYPEDEDKQVEHYLETYCILGCLICYSHSCEHGEYDTRNFRRPFSIMPHLSDTLKRRGREIDDPVNVPSNLSTLCSRTCYRGLNCLPDGAKPLPWSEDERVVLRSILITSYGSKVKQDPFCLVAQFLDRDCWDVYCESSRLNIPPPRHQPVHHPSITSVPWYNPSKRTLTRDWRKQTVTHDHQQRGLVEPCSHDGPCTLETCTCVQNRLLCEKFCGCSVQTCAYKFTGCACHSQGKICFSRQKKGTCICLQLNRECDPELCGTCGAFERADPENAEDDRLHSSGCQNCALQRGKAKSLLLGESQLEGVGYGLFTAQSIARDDFIIEYVGEIIHHDEGVRREARRVYVFGEEANVSYVFTLLENEGIWVDAAIYGNLSRYINHASKGGKYGCNITPQILYVNGEYRIKFRATRDIKVGEELFFNYGKNFSILTKKRLDDKPPGMIQLE